MNIGAYLERLCFIEHVINYVYTCKLDSKNKKTKTQFIVDL